MASASTPFHLAVALDGAGWHPAAWREPSARPAELLTGRYWTDVITEAERGLLDFVTVEDGFSVQSARADRVTGRLDAVLIAARVAPLTRHIGLIPTVVVTHTEPFHISKAIATLDYASNGRAGVRVRVSASPQEAALFGRRDLPELDLSDRDDPAVRQLTAALFDEAADYVEVIRRLWDSWDDDAEIRDAATGRFIDRERLHYIDFAGDYFSVKGPSITPRPPQGQPIVSALGHGTVPYQLIAKAADVGFVTPADADHARRIVAEIDEARRRRRPGARARRPGRVPRPERGRRGRAQGAPRRARRPPLPERRDRLRRHRRRSWRTCSSTGSRRACPASGSGPAAIPDDLEAITRELVPELQRRGAFRTAYESGTLRGLLGLRRPASRYAQVGSN